MTSTPTERRHLAAGHLGREFRAAYGGSRYAYLRTRRFERAIALLGRGDLSVAVAVAVAVARTAAQMENR